MKKIGKFNCRYMRSGLIEIEFHAAFTAPDKIPIAKFFTKFAKRNHYKLPCAIEFVR